MIKVNVAAFGAKMPNKIAISNTAPPGIQTLQEIVKELGEHDVFSLLIPDKTLVKLYKAGGMTWEAFRHGYVIQVRYLNLPKIMGKLCRCYGGDDNEITLCCYEAATDEHCHRKILYDMLPEEIRGERK